MTIKLSKEVENSIHAAMLSGRFAAVEDAISEAVRLLLNQLEQAQPAASGDAADHDPLLGLWRDYADEMDEIVADAYRKRRVAQAGGV